MNLFLNVLKYFIILLIVLPVIYFEFFIKYFPEYNFCLKLQSKPKFIVPLKGIKNIKIISPFNAPRSGGRKHKGIDIYAPIGTQVIAPADGQML